MNLPWSPASEPNVIELFEIDARAGFDQPAKKHSVTISRGPKALIEYYQFSAVSDDQLQNAFKQNLEGSQSWNAIEKVTWRFDTAHNASILDIAGTGPVDWDEDGIGKSLSLPGGGFSPPQRRQRGANADATAPYLINPDFNCTVTTLRMPNETSDSDWSYNTAYNTVIYGQSFRRSFERRDGTIRMIRANRTIQTELPADIAAKDTARLPKFDNSMAWAYFKQGTLAKQAVKEQVPATFEVDWVKDSSACLNTTFAKP